MKREIFGTQKNGEVVEIVTLQNQVAELKVMTRGATIVSFNTYGTDIVGGYDRLEEYENDTAS